MNRESFHCDNNICKSICVIHSFFSQLSESSMFCMFCMKPILLANNNVLLLLFRQTCKSLRNEVVIIQLCEELLCCILLMLFLFILGIIQELGDQLNKVKAEKEKALKSLKTLKVNHDVSVSVLMAPKPAVNVKLKDIQWYFSVLI